MFVNTCCFIGVNLRDCLQPESGYLDHVYAVLDRVGAVRGSNVSDWNLLWSHDYPFMDEQLKPALAHLTDRQLVNHIPGSGYYTSKVRAASKSCCGQYMFTGESRDEQHHGNSTRFRTSRPKCRIHRVRACTSGHILGAKVE
jgi:hypothetical protein